MSNLAKYTFAMIVPVALGLVACKGEDERAVSQSEAVKLAAATTDAVAFPKSLPVIGDGFPDSGDACRRLGENDLTSEWMDDRSILVGCPTRIDARQLGGKLVSVVDGITVVTIAKSAPGVMMVSPVGNGAASGDALVKGAGYNASVQVACAFDGEVVKRICPVGITHNWGTDGTTLVEVSKPDGRKRAIYFRGIKAYGADSAQADGSAAYEFNVTRRDAESLISYGPERYIVPDTLVVGS